MKSKKESSDMNAREYNYMVSCVNDGTPRKIVEKAFNKEQMKRYDSMVARLKEERKTNPKAAYFPIENEW